MSTRRADSAIDRFMIQREKIGALQNESLAITYGARARDVEALMASVFATSQDGILIVGQDQRIDVCNAAAKVLLGDHDDRMSHQPVARFLPEFDPAEQHGHYRDSTARRLDGRQFPVEYAVTTVGLESQAVQVVVLRDISERKSHEESLRHQATHDPLTGLPNRTLLADMVTERITQAKMNDHRFALLLLDLDRFKEINDTLGHDIGDDLLCRLANLLRDQCPELGFVARLGGDEFALLIDRVDSVQAALDIADDLAVAIEKPVVLRDLSLSVEASIGVALYPDHAVSMKDLLRCADVAMYEAKKRRCRFSTYDANVDRNSIRHLTLSGELKRAVEDHVMVLAYQPKLCLTAHRPFTAEALLRWTHPSLGNVSPTEFIPQAEQTGLIGTLTAHTLSCAIAQMSDWERRGLALSVAVNLSAQVIHDQRLPVMVQDLLSRHDLAPERLTLELTESAIMHDPEGALLVAHQIAEIGGQSFDRRLRHRLFFPRLSEPAAGSRIEDRSIVRVPHADIAGLTPPSCARQSISPIVWAWKWLARASTKPKFFIVSWNSDAIMARDF